MFWGTKSDNQKLKQEELVDDDLNIIVLGDSQVGKTTLLEEYCGTRDDEYVAEATNGLAIHCKRLKFGNRSISAVFHDFGGDIAQRLGQEFFVKDLVAKHSTKSEVFPFAAVIVVFDCTAKHSLYQMKGWLHWFFVSAQDAARKVLQSSRIPAFEKHLSELPVLVLGNKIDLLSAEPFYYFESGRQPQDQRDRLADFTSSAARGLRAQLCMPDCENLLFASAECNPFKLADVLDRAVAAVHLKASSGIMNEEFSLCGVPLVRCIKGKAFKEEIMGSGWINSLKKMFFRDDEPSLPL